MERTLAPALVVLLVASAGCLGSATAPLHPPSGPADERVGTRAPGGGGAGGPDGQGGLVGDGTTTPQAVKIPAFDFREGADGNVVVELTVENTAAESRSVILVAALEVNGTIEEAATEATLDPGERTTLDIHFDGDWDDFTPNLAYARVQAAP